MARELTSSVKKSRAYLSQSQHSTCRKRLSRSKKRLKNVHDFNTTDAFVQKELEPFEESPKDAEKDQNFSLEQTNEEKADTQKHHDSLFSPKDESAFLKKKRYRK